MQLLNKALVGLLPLVPKSVVGRLSSRYIAGETKHEALQVVRDLNNKGFMATLDILGEFVTDLDGARGTAEEYMDLLRAIYELGLDANVSIKLTQLGLTLDSKVCYSLIRKVALEANRLNNFLRLDMEDSLLTQETLEIHARLRREMPNVGCVIQAYLRRSERDITDLVEIQANIRLCKGIYVEAEEIAFQSGLEINQNFNRILETLLQNKIYTGIATHDDRLVSTAYELIEKYGRTPDEYEFQMLLGVTEALRRRIVDRGHRLRVYVPFGSQWYDYSIRRLKENPQMVGYAIKGILTRGQ